MNEIYFWHRKSSYQMQIYLIVSILTYLVSRNLYLKSKFILSTFRSPLLSNYPSVTKKKIHCTVKICSVFVVKWNWQLSDVFVLIAEQQKKKRRRRITSIGDDTLTEREVMGYYFHCGYGYKAIVHLLKTYCDISMILFCVQS